MLSTEQAGVFGAAGQEHIGVLHLPEVSYDTGIVIVPGAPQTRTGAHRLFVQIARQLAADYWPVLRFDRSGFGDSLTERADFLDAAADIDAAIRHLKSAVPTVEQIVLLGLCDGATAAALHGPGMDGVAGLILLNPWARTEQGRARAMLASHYRSQMTSGSAWMNLLGAPRRAAASAGEFLATLRTSSPGNDDGAAPYIAQMIGNLRDFDGDVQVILSADDLTAHEFDGTVRRNAGWRTLKRNGSISRVWIRQADHTFTTRHERSLATDAIGRFLAERFTAA